MKREDLYEGFGGLNDEVLKRSEKGVGAMKKRNVSKMVKWGSLAACFILAVGIGMFFINSNKTAGTENDEVEEGHSIAIYPDVAPMVYVNNTLFKKSLEEVHFEEMLEEFIYVGEIESDITSNQTSTDGVPKENLQANTPIVGSEVYQYGDNIVVKVGGIYWLYEAQGAGNGDNNSKEDWDSLTEEEKMELDPTYNAN